MWRGVVIVLQGLERWYGESPDTLESGTVKARIH